MTSIAHSAAGTAWLASIETRRAWYTNSIVAGIARFTLYTVVASGRVIVARRTAVEYGNDVTGW